MEALRRLQDERTYKDVAELVRQQAIVAEGLKRFEFGLRRKVEGEQNAIALSGADESPEAYKKANEQYFRSLSKAASNSTPNGSWEFASDETPVSSRRLPHPHRGAERPRSAARSGLRPRRAAEVPTKDTFGHGFNFCRGMFTRSIGAGGQGWSTDYPDAELNFSIRLSELTKTRVAFDRSRTPDFVTVRLPTTIFQCPQLHMEDVGTIEFEDDEIEALRAGSEGRLPLGR